MSEFNKSNGLDLVCRSHQLVMEGYKYMFDKELVAVWSAPNYCYRCGNVASIMKVSEGLTCEFKVYEAVPANERGIPSKKPPPDYFL